MNRTTITTSTVRLWLDQQSCLAAWVTVPGTINVDATGRIADLYAHLVAGREFARTTCC